MNTANLQLEGLYAAVSGLVETLRRKQLLTEAEIDETLLGVERAIAAHADRPELSAAHLEAICFPARILRAANRAAASGRSPSFTELTAAIGRQKDGARSG